MTRLTFTLAAVLLSGFPIAHAADTGNIEKRLAPCMTCHGKQGRAASDVLSAHRRQARWLSLQPAHQFPRRTARAISADELTVQPLSDDYLHEMAEYFAGLHVPHPAPAATS